MLLQCSSLVCKPKSGRSWELTIFTKSSEAVARRCSVKEVLLEISQNSQENSCTKVSFLIKLQASTLLKIRLWHRCFPVNFAKFLRAAFLTEYLWWLLLNIPLKMFDSVLNMPLNFINLSSYLRSCLIKKYQKPTTIYT